MYRKICNRCGKDIAEQEADNELAYTGKRTTRHGYDQTIHLCIGCIELFRKFMGVYGGKIKIEQNYEKSEDD